MDLVHAALRGLKDFQRRTVDYAFNRLYGEDPTRRMLISDEVGLGKTMVAKGLVARATVRLWDEVDRIDVIYICSNQDIARQNMDRLGQLAQGDSAIQANRLTMLAQQIPKLKGQKLNFLALTPGTSFDLGGNLGVSSERAILYLLLRRHWGFSSSAKGPYKVFQGNAKYESFKAQVERFEQGSTDLDAVVGPFGKQVQKADSLKAEFDALCEAFAHRSPPIPEDLRARRNEFVGKLRAALASTCVEMLEPDLVILDEFQRFKDLMTGQGEDSLLARQLFEYGDARVVLLSATPYKMLTLASQGEEEDHYADFLDTLSFLITDKSALDRTVSLVEEFRQQLLRLRTGGSAAALIDLKEALEAQLRKVIVRTERLSATQDAQGMLADRRQRADLVPRDLRGYLGAQSIARAVGDREMMEFWKSAPAPMSFLDGYKLREKMKADLGAEPSAAIAKTLARFPEVAVDMPAIRDLRRIELQNPRLRALETEVLDQGAWKALWMPATMPYYEAAGPFADLRRVGFTKRLVFSAWRMVPRAIATLLSHSADACIIQTFEERVGPTKSAERWPVALLRVQSVADGRLTGMALMNLLYPSIALAKLDPMKIAAELKAAKGSLPTFEEMLQQTRVSVAALLEPHQRGKPQSGAVDERWYWAALALLDRADHGVAAGEWFSQEDLDMTWQGMVAESSDGWRQHVEALARLRNADDLGRPPADLADVLSEAAIASPAVCALRALSRHVPAGRLHPSVRNAAAQIAWSIRNQVNLPQSIAVIRGQVSTEPYWRGVLQYAAMGDLQAVLDEWVHCLKESLGLQDKTTEGFIDRISEAIQSALAVRAGRIGMDELKPDPEGQRFSMETQLLSTRFAMQYGSEHSVEAGTRASEDDVSRTGKVQDAFNSPFWPFVLASTSQGQEGLDFHPYCHCVVHWNLPSNPVDLEQREGRVHRYKGHAVRKNVAARHGESALAADGDPWLRAFDIAKSSRAPHHNDLIPYWIYPIEGGAQIERCVPLLPLSREADRIVDLRKTLAVYRMVFGQPRQDDLIELLLTRFPEEEVRDLARSLRIDLSPPASLSTNERGISAGIEPVHSVAAIAPGADP